MTMSSNSLGLDVGVWLTNIRHYKPLIAGVGCQQVVCAAGKVVNLANGAVGGIVGIEVIAGIIVATTLSQGGIRQGAALRVQH